MLTHAGHEDRVVTAGSPAGSYQGVVGDYFADNYDHLRALELEAKLMLAVALLRSFLQKKSNGSTARERYTQLPLLPPDVDLAQAELLLAETASRNRQMEAASCNRGIALNFLTLCQERHLDAFERSAVMLLLMRYAAPDFADMFLKCDFESMRFRSSGMRIGTLLAIICSDFRRQLDSRRYFSTESTLARGEVVIFQDSMDDSTNILDVTVCLHERIVRLVLGDRNIYNSAFNFIRRERSNVSLDQVIMPESLKQEVVAAVGNFLKDRAAGRLDRLDAFFGYGTGLAFLFHGPPGTGKTMLARALASHFERQVISFTAGDLVQRNVSPEQILAVIFREAEVQGCVVLLDECDDLFENNSRLSQALLIELEKARCVVILATNKPVDLDPAMERRVAMKISFPIPDADLRLKMWHSLLPDRLELEPDVDLAQFASRYHFSGGLIKNCILLAATLASRDGGGVRISRAQLERAADLQNPAPADEGRICRKYTPVVTVAGLQLRTRDKDELQGATLAWRQLQREGLGLNVLISASDVATGVLAAEALARECGLEVRQFDYALAQSLSEPNFVVDPVTQRKVSPLTYAFSESLGASALTLFVDHAGDIAKYLDRKGSKEKDFYLSDLEAKLRTNSGLFCMVTSTLKPQPLPVEFHLHFALEHPPEYVQIQRWEECLKNDRIRENELVALVERWPMHASEIDFMARQASVLAVIRGGSGRPGLLEVREVIGRYRRTARSPVLFGGD